MSVYKLKIKVEKAGEMGIWARIAKGGHLDCVLNVEENYYIQRYIDHSLLFYVHVKNGRLTKVCVYEKEKDNGNNKS